MALKKSLVLKRYKKLQLKCSCGCGTVVMLQFIPDTNQKYNLLMVDVRERKEKGKKKQEWHGVSLEKKSTLKIKHFIGGI